MRNLALAMLLTCLAGAAQAQNIVCPTRALGDATNACASDQFVQQQLTATTTNPAITALTGDVVATGPGSVAATIQPGVVTGSKIASGTVANSNLANFAADTVHCNATGSPAAPTYCTNPIIAGITLNPTASTINQGLLITQTGAGSENAGITTPFNTGDYGLNYLTLTDNISGPTAGNGSRIADLLIYHKFGGTSTVGSRATVDILLNMTAPSGASQTNALRNYQPLITGFYSNQNDGGTNTGAGAQGGGFGAGFVAILDSGATNWLNVTGQENNVAVLSGATVQYKSMLQLASLPQDAVNGAVYDAMLGMSAQTGSIGWKNGILFGNMNGQQPLASTGCLICTTGSSTITTGIDASSYTFTGNAIHTPGFTVNNIGQLTIASGATASVTDLTLSDTAAGSFVAAKVINNSAASGSLALLQMATGLANSSVNFEVIQSSGSASSVLFQWGTAVTGGFAFNNTTNGNIAFFVNGLQLGSPTGGDKGVGSLNFAGSLWTNGTQGLASKTCTTSTAGATITITNGIITGTTVC